MGGKFTVDENACRLLRFFYFERRLMQGLGSWTPSIPDFEVKIETGRHIFWHADKDWQSEYDLARITWDEARHTEIGYRTMQTMGYDPYELPNRLTSSTCRVPMEPEYAMAEINLFGEVDVIKTINDFIDQARGRDDAVLAHIGDFIRSDERTHVRKGQGIIKIMTDKSMQELELRTRELFTECLVSLGAVKPEGDLFVISREDLEHYVGE
jgi:hypothetical protein